MPTDEENKYFRKALERQAKEVDEVANKSREAIALIKMTHALEALIMAKPEERSELARRYAVTITEMEKALAYFKTYVNNGSD